MIRTAAAMERPVQGWDQPGQNPARWTQHAALPALRALHTAPACGRAWTRVVLSTWDLEASAEAAVVVVSELVTNAVLACGQRYGAVVHLSLACDREQLLVLVRDFEAGMPVPRRAGDDAEDGRGLPLVGSMSSRHGWSPPGDGTAGKIVWAILALP